MAKGGVVHEDVFLRDALGDQIGFKDVVRGARIDIVGAEQGEFLHAQSFQEIVGGRDRLLVRGGAGVKHVLRRFLAFVLHRIEQQAVQFLDHRQNRLAADRSPAAEHHVDLRHGQQLARLFGKQRPVRSRVDHHGLDLLAQQPALGVLLLDQHQHGVLQRGFRNRHRARQRMQHAHLDGVLRLRHACGQRHGAGQPVTLDCLHLVPHRGRSRHGSFPHWRKGLYPDGSFGCTPCGGNRFLRSRFPPHIHVLRRAAPHIPTLEPALACCNAAWTKGVTCGHIGQALGIAASGCPVFRRSLARDRRPAHLAAGRLSAEKRAQGQFTSAPRCRLPPASPTRPAGATDRAGQGKRARESAGKARGRQRILLK